MSSPNTKKKRKPKVTAKISTTYYRPAINTALINSILSATVQTFWREVQNQIQLLI